MIDDDDDRTTPRYSTEQVSRVVHLVLFLGLSIGLIVGWVGAIVWTMIVGGLQ